MRRDCWDSAPSGESRLHTRRSVWGFLWGSVWTPVSPHVPGACMRVRVCLKPAEDVQPSVVMKRMALVKPGWQETFHIFHFWNHSWFMTWCHICNSAQSSDREVRLSVPFHTPADDTKPYMTLCLQWINGYSVSRAWWRVQLKRF